MCPISLSQQNSDLHRNINVSFEPLFALLLFELFVDNNVAFVVVDAFDVVFDVDVLVVVVDVVTLTFDCVDVEPTFVDVVAVFAK